MEKEKSVKSFSAAEARALADSTTLPLKRIYKAIEEEATEGITSLVWSLDNLSNVQVDTIKSALKAEGYKVEFEKDTSNFGTTMAICVKW